MSKRTFSITVVLPVNRDGRREGLYIYFKNFLFCTVYSQ